MKNKNKKDFKEFNKLPVKVSRKDFNKYILPFLSKGRRGPKPKISLYKIFNYILYVLPAGCQWERLPIHKMKFIGRQFTRAIIAGAKTEAIKICFSIQSQFLKKGGN